MEARIVAKTVVASDIQSGLKKLRKKYPHLRYITYKNLTNYRDIKKPKSTTKRKIKIAFVDDFRKVLEQAEEV